MMNHEDHATAMDAYISVNARAGWADRSDRSRLKVSGPDRAKFLHNLTTNDVKRLAEGSGHESFVTSPQGKVLAYITLISSEDSTILVRTDQGSLESMLPHLNKFGIFEDVLIEDVSAQTFEYHLAGPLGGPILEARGIELPVEGQIRHRAITIEGTSVRIVRESPTGRSGLSLIGPIEKADSIKAILLAEGVPKIDATTFDALRIEAGTPLSGRDVSLNNLPQEVGRDSLTINFVKGCYLGQETVARLDALGHVNRIFKGLRFEGSVIPPSGASLMSDGKLVGFVSSSAFSKGWGVPIGLAYIRVAQAIPGNRLVVMMEEMGELTAVVSDLPMLPPSPS